MNFDSIIKQRFANFQITNISGKSVEDFEIIISVCFSCDKIIIYVKNNCAIANYLAKLYKLDDIKYFIYYKNKYLFLTHETSIDENLALIQEMINIDDKSVVPFNIFDDLCIMCNKKVSLKYYDCRERKVKCESCQ